MRGEMTWYRFLTLAVGFSLWFLCFFTFVLRGWKKKQTYGKDTPKQDSL